MDFFCSVSVCITPNFGAQTSDQQEKKKKRGTIVEERRDTNEEIIIPGIYWGLLCAMRQENKQTFSLDSFDSDQHAL